MKIPQTAEEVAYQLMDMFCMFGGPFILQSEMAANLQTKYYKTWLICGQVWCSCMEIRDIFKVNDKLKEINN